MQEHLSDTELNLSLEMNVLMHQLIAGEQTPTGAKELSVLTAEKYNNSLMAGKKPFDLQGALSLVDQHLMPTIRKVCQTREYDECYRACFGAILVGPRGLVDGPCWNRVPPHALSVCRGDRYLTCIRDAVGKAASNSYSNCPATHAAVQLLPLHEQTDHLIWLEVGAVRDQDGKFAPWVWDANSPDPMKRIYRCSMCLSQSYAKGIHYVGQVVWRSDEEWKHERVTALHITPHLVLADLLGMMVVETANSIAP